MELIDKILIVIIISLIILLTFVPSNVFHEETIRQPAFDGTWYQSNPQILSKQIDLLLNSSKKIIKEGKVRAIIMPHAGLQYSGAVAALSVRQLENDYENVFILAPSHRYPLVGLSIMNVTFYKTPLGLVPLSKKALTLKENPLIQSIYEAHVNEHAIEIELPFLQRKINNLKIVPILVGQSNPDEVSSILKKNLGENDLLVISVDLSHFHTHDEAILLDEFSINSIMSLNEKAIMDAEIDAPWAVNSLLQLAKEKSWKPVFLGYANSGMITGDNSNVVGYSSIAFIEDTSLTESEKTFLLDLARNKLNSIYSKEDFVIPIIPENLKEVRGCFSTLNKNNELRGCIGHILPQKPLYECVIENIQNAALKDSRFNPVIKSEKDNLKIEISVLSVPKKVKFNEITPFTDGVVIKNHFKQATYLPQVWKDLPDVELFFTSLCKKANLNSDCYKDSKTEFYTYQAQVFEE